jgi:hypothetical protein
MNNYSYAKLGYSCQNTNDSLLSNMKFLPQDSPDYNMKFTKMLQYPGQSYDLSKSVDQPSFPEDIKTKKGEAFIQPKCCGK